jgi:hypothetical protein
MLKQSLLYLPASVLLPLCDSLLSLPDLNAGLLGELLVNGNTYTEIIAFEVMRVRPDQETEAFFQQAFFEVLP